MRNSSGRSKDDPAKQKCQQRTEPFTISTHGNYIGQDGFVVPKNFPEFFAKNSNYVRRWASKWLHRFENDDAVRDWEQELLLYLNCLPETSKSRTVTDRYPEGRTDVIQCFDPHRHYGASGCRFFNFLNICLHNRSLTILERMRKNPACRKDNLSVAASSDPKSATVDDEYIHSHSESVQRKSAQESSSVEKRLFVKRFMEFVLVNEPHLYRTMLAVADARTLREAQQTLQVGEETLLRDHRRIIQLRDAFLDGGPIPKQRKPYRKRIEKGHSSISMVLAT